MYFYIFVVVLTLNGVKASIENVEKSNEEINCTKENSIINVTPIKDVGAKGFLVQIGSCKSRKINYNALTLSEENCFTLSGKSNEQHASIYCFPVKEMSQNYRISRPKDDLRTRMGIQFEYCGNNVQNDCCKDEELSSKGYKCLVNEFGEFGFYQARYWKLIPTTNLIQIDKAEINHKIIKRGRGRPSTYSSGYRQSRFSNRPEGHNGRGRPSSPGYWPNGGHHQPSQSSNYLPNTPEAGNEIGADNTADNGAGTTTDGGVDNGLRRYQPSQPSNDLGQVNEPETGNGIGAGTTIDGGVDNGLGQPSNDSSQFNELEAGNGVGAGTTTDGGAGNGLDRYQLADNGAESATGAVSDNGAESDGDETDGVESINSNNDGKVEFDPHTHLGLFASDIYDPFF